MADKMQELRDAVNQYRERMHSADADIAAADTRITTLKMEIAQLERAKVVALQGREDDAIKMNGLKRLVRDLEDRETQRERAKEDEADPS